MKTNVGFFYWASSGAMVTAALLLCLSHKSAVSGKVLLLYRMALLSRLICLRHVMSVRAFRSNEKLYNTHTPMTLSAKLATRVRATHVNFFFLFYISSHFYFPSAYILVILEFIDHLAEIMATNQMPSSLHCPYWCSFFFYSSASPEYGTMLFHEFGRKLRLRFPFNPNAVDQHLKVVSSALYWG